MEDEVKKAQEFELINIRHPFTRCKAYLSAVEKDIVGLKMVPDEAETMLDSINEIAKHLFIVIAKYQQDNKPIIEYANMQKTEKTKIH